MTIQTHLSFCFKLAEQIPLTLKYLSFCLDRMEFKSIKFSSKSCCPRWKCFSIFFDFVIKVLLTLSTEATILSKVKLGKFTIYLLQVYIFTDFKFCKSAVNSFGHNIDLKFVFWGRIIFSFNLFAFLYIHFLSGIGSITLWAVPPWQ